MMGKKKISRRGRGRKTLLLALLLVLSLLVSVSGCTCGRPGGPGPVPGEEDLPGDSLPGEALPGEEEGREEEEAGPGESPDPAGEPGDEGPPGAQRDPVAPGDDPGDGAARQERDTRAVTEYSAVQDPDFQFITNDGLIPGKLLVIVKLPYDNLEQYRVEVGGIVLEFGENFQAFYAEVLQEYALPENVEVYRR